jgi:HK97 family phage prohead protease
MARIKSGKKSLTSIPVEIKEINKEKYTLTMIASSQDVDRHGDTILQDGWDLKHFKKNPVILNSHNYNDATEVIARATKTWIEGKGKKSKMLQTWEFAVDANPKAKIIFDLYAGGFLHASSVGFIPTEFDKQKDGSTDYYTIKQAELLEVSAVSVPANAAATLAKSIGIDTDELKGAIKVLDDDDETEDEIETPEEDKTETVETPEEEDTETEPEETEVETPEEEDETVEPDPEEQEPEIPEEKKVKAPSRKSLYAKAIHKLNDRQETDLKIARDTIEKMLKGESTEVKRDFNSIIRRLLKAKK